MVSRFFMDSKELDTIGTEFVKLIKEQFDNKKLNDTGGAKESISYRVDHQKLTIEGLARVLFLEFGRRPGKPPPFGVIKDWVERKLNVSDEEVYPVTHAIVKKIAKEGTDILTDRAKGLQMELIIDDLLKELQEMITIFEANAITDSLYNTWLTDGFK